MKQYYNITPFDNMKDFTDWKDELFSNPDFQYFATFDSLEGLFEEFEYQGFNKKQVEILLSTRYGNVIEVGIIEGDFYAFTGAR